MQRYEDELYLAQAQVARLAEELEQGDYWMQRAKEYQENGGCPWCFGNDERGHKTGCYVGELEGKHSYEQGRAERFKGSWKQSAAKNDELRNKLREAQAQVAGLREAMADLLLLRFHQSKKGTCLYCDQYPAYGHYDYCPVSKANKILSTPAKFSPPPRPTA